MHVSARYSAALAGGLAIIVYCNPAWSQSDTVAKSPQEMANQAASGALEEIVVTATKRSETIQSIPSSISAFSGADLERRGAMDVESIASKTPNLQFGETNGTSFVSIRGVGSSIDTGTGEPSVGIYIDGVNLPRPTMGFLDESDLERVEVLRGPQGTLYGRNATGGTINFVSQAPTDTFSAGVSVGGGDYTALNTSGFVSGPLTSAVDGRISAGYEYRDGYVKDLLTDREDVGGVKRFHTRGALRIRPADSVTIDASLSFDRNTGENSFQQTYTQSPLAPPGTLQTTAPNTLYSDYYYADIHRTGIGNITVNWDINDWLHLKSTSGIVDHQSDVTLDGDGTNAAIVNVVGFQRPSRSESQEFALTGENGPLKWLAGATYFHENYTAILPVVIPLGIPGALPPGGISLQELRETTKDVAVFTDFSVHLVGGLKLLGGGRWFRTIKDDLQTVGAQLPGLGFFGAYNVPESLNETKFLPKVGLQYDFTRDIMAYAQFQRGFTAGGFNISDPGLEFQPERLDSYEAGVKTAWLDHRITANASYFHYRYLNYQVTEIILTTSLTSNAQAKTDGAEVEIGWQPTDALHFNVGLSALNARYTEFSSSNPATGTVVNLDDKPLERSPRSTQSIGASYAVPVNAGVVRKVTFGADVYHTSQYALRYFDTVNDVQTGYTKANLFSDIGFSDDRYHLKLFVNNVGDVLYKRSIIFSPIQGGYLGDYAEPRMYGAKFSAKF